MIKAVIWWYDHRHDGGTTPHDKVHLTLQACNDIAESWYPVTSSTTDDNKQRVFVDGVANKEYRLKLTGDDVTSDATDLG